MSKPSKPLPRHPREIEATEAQRALCAQTEAAVQSMYLRRAFPAEGERAIMIKALQAYAGMVPLEPATRAIAERLVKKIEEDPHGDSDA